MSILDSAVDKQSSFNLSSQAPCNNVAVASCGGDSVSGDVVVLPGHNMASKLKRNIAAIIFLLLVITVCVVMLAIVLTARDSSSTDQPRPTTTQQPTTKSLHRFSIRDWFSGAYYPQYPRVRWISGSEILDTRGGNITVTSLLTNKSEVLVPVNILKPLKAYWHSFSADRQWALLRSNYSKMYRHSYFADYSAYHIPSGSVVKLDPPDASQQIQLVIWGNTANKLAFVQNNNIYYKACANCTTQTITNTGETNKIYNGIPDWVYEEDVYGKNFALWFSPDDSYLGYGQFNDTQVTWFSYMHYGPYKDAYTQVKKIAYPKPGFANPTAKAKLVNLTALPNDTKQVPTTTVFQPPQDFHNVEHYFTGMDWADNERLTVGWANRVQNITIIMICNATSASCHENHRQEFNHGWVPTESYMRKRWFSKDRSYFLLLFPFEQGELGKFLHLGKITVPSNQPGNIANLTYGAWEATFIAAFDEQNDIAYITSTETSPRELHLYSVNVKTMEKTCISCTLPWAISGRCKYFTPSFSSDVTWYTLTCNGPGVPIVSRHNTKTNEITILNDNGQLIEKLKGLAVPIKRNFEFTSGDYEIKCLEILPPNFDETKKYAVLFNVYGGPSSQRVLESFTIGWDEYLVSNFDIIVVRIDARGTRRRGERFKHAVYLKLGEYEAEDTINAGRYMQSKPYVDKDKLAIWGWSYGGYLTTYVLSKNSGVFKVGLAVAPVTDWHYYDTAYTERYMRTPQDNPDGYKYTSLLSRAEKFANVSYLIVHGSGDDNVHFQHTAQMVKALTYARIEFRVQYYTDKAHSISGARVHLYTLLTDYLTTKLALTAARK